MQDMMMDKKRGKGWHGNPEGHAEAGQKGGQTTAEQYGSEFYSRIGRQGGKRSQGGARKKA